QAPADQTVDLDRLTATRAELAPKLTAARVEVERLQTRKRPRKERKRPDADLHTAQLKLSRLEEDRPDVNSSAFGDVGASGSGRSPEEWSGGGERSGGGFECDAVAEGFEPPLQSGGFGGGAGSLVPPVDPEVGV